MNRVIRHSLRTAAALAVSTTQDLISRCPVWGIIEVQQCGHRLKYYSEGDDIIADRLYYGGDLESHEMRAFLSACRSSEYILDIGANTGLYSVLSSLANRNATIYAFEPHPANMRRLRQNLSLNACVNVIAIESAVSDRRGSILLTIPADGSISDVASAIGDFARAYRGPAAREITVDCVSVDDYVRDAPIPRVDLIKIDVEYYEEHVLGGARRTIERFSPIVLCEVFAYEPLVAARRSLTGRISADHSPRIEEYFRELGYSSYCFAEHGLLKVDSLCRTPDKRNFLFVKRKGSRPFLPYAELDGGLSL